MTTDPKDRPWWERVSDPDPEIREQAHKEGELEADAHYPDIEPESTGSESTGSEDSEPAQAT